MRVIVVGAGIGGLAVAGGLQRAGADVSVLERSPQPQLAGSGLSLFRNGIAALDALGAEEPLRAATSSHASDMRAGQRDPTGRWLSVLPSEATSGLRVVHRVELLTALARDLRPGTVRAGAEVVSASPDGTVASRRRHDAASSEDRADLVVGADGIRSLVRRGWPTDPGTRHAGYSAWRGVTDRPVDLDGAAGETWGRGLRFGIAPLADGRVYWFAVASMPPRIHLSDEAERVLHLFGHWHAPIRELITSTDPATVTRLDIEDLARPLPSFVRGSVVLLGDAAHAMTPDLGQGANQAFEDAATLTNLLAPLAGCDPDPADLAERLARYDLLRRPRTQRIARRARALGRIGQASHPAAATLRDLALRSMPTRLVSAQAQAVQAWTPPPRDAAVGEPRRAAQ